MEMVKMFNNKRHKKFKCTVCCKFKTNKGRASEPIFEHRPEFTIDILQTVYPNTKLALSDIKHICQWCEEAVNKMCDFKLCCLDIDDYLKNFLNKEDKIDMKEVYLHVYEISCVDDSEKQDLCRLCLESIEDISYFTAEEEQLQEMLRICLPELDTSLTDKFLVCSICMEHLRRQHNLIKKLAKIEDTISQNKSQKKPEKTELPIDNCDPNLKKRKLEPEDKTQYKCAKCEYVSKEEKSLQLHILLTHLDVNSVISEKISNGSKTYACRECPFESFRDYIMWSHVLLHDNIFADPTLRCKFCKYKTLNKRMMEIHKKKHNEYRPKSVDLYQCTLCSFKGYKNPVYHHRRHIKQNSKILKCGTCLFRTNQRQRLQQHIECHNGGRTVRDGPNYFKCMFCEFETIKSKTFSMHWRLCVKDTSNKFYVLMNGEKSEPERSD